MKKNSTKQSIYAIIILIAFILSAFLGAKPVSFQEAYRTGKKLLESQGINDQASHTFLQERLLLHADLTTTNMIIDTQYILPSAEEAIMHHVEQKSLQEANTKIEDKKREKQIKDDKKLAEKLNRELNSAPNLKQVIQKKDTQPVTHSITKNIAAFFEKIRNYFISWTTEHKKAEKPNIAYKPVFHRDTSKNKKEIATSKKSTEPIVVISVANQSGNTCGYHTVANLQAIQELAQEKKEITDKNVMERARKYLKKSFCVRMLEDYEVEQLAHTAKLSNFILLGFHQETIDAQGKPFLYTSVNDEEDVDIDALYEKPKNFFATIKNNKNIVANIAANIYNNHWVAISIVKNSGKTTLYYMDSQNAGLSGSNSFQARKRLLVDYVKKNIA